jgi:hypothetical protein
VRRVRDSHEAWVRSGSWRAIRLVRGSQESRRSAIWLERHERRFMDGGESGIRTFPDPMESVTYRFHEATVAVNASVAVAHCTPLPADSAVWKAFDVAAGRKPRPFQELRERDVPPLPLA